MYYSELYMHCLLNPNNLLRVDATIHILQGN